MDSLEDMVSNLDNRLILHNQGYIYQGFYDTLQTILPEITLAIKDFQDNNQLIYITGHSQGGALAMLELLSKPMKETGTVRSPIVKPVSLNNRP